MPMVADATLPVGLCCRALLWAGSLPDTTLLVRPVISYNETDDICCRIASIFEIPLVDVSACWDDDRTHATKSSAVQ